jgi:hypothetical protein
VDKEIQKAELPMIQQIIEDEKWLLGEERGKEIKDNDPELRKRVVGVILRYGAEMRQKAKDENKS